MKQLTEKEVGRLQNILNRTKKRRTIMKLIKRISDGTIEYFTKWINDIEAHKTIDNTNPGIRMPESIELVKRYGGE